MAEFRVSSSDLLAFLQEVKLIPERSEESGEERFSSSLTYSNESRTSGTPNGSSGRKATQPVPSASPMSANITSSSNNAPFFPKTHPNAAVASYLQHQLIPKPKSRAIPQCKCTRWVISNGRILPTVCMEQVLSFLTIREVSVARATCRVWNEEYAPNHGTIWRQLRKTANSLASRNQLTSPMLSTPPNHLEMTMGRARAHSASETDHLSLSVPNIARDCSRSPVFDSDLLSSLQSLGPFSQFLGEKVLSALTELLPPPSASFNAQTPKGTVTVSHSFNDSVSNSTFGPSRHNQSQSLSLNCFAKNKVFLLPPKATDLNTSTDTTACPAPTAEIDAAQSTPIAVDSERPRFTGLMAISPRSAFRQVASMPTPVANAPAKVSDSLQPSDDPNTIHPASSDSQHQKRSSSAFTFGLRRSSSDSKGFGLSSPANKAIAPSITAPIRAVPSVHEQLEDQTKPLQRKCARCLSISPATDDAILSPVISPLDHPSTVKTTSPSPVTSPALQPSAFSPPPYRCLPNSSQIVEERSGPWDDTESRRPSISSSTSCDSNSSDREKLSPCPGHQRHSSNSQLPPMAPLKTKPKLNTSLPSHSLRRSASYSAPFEEDKVGSVNWFAEARQFVLLDNPRARRRLEMVRFFRQWAESLKEPFRINWALRAAKWSDLLLVHPLRDDSPASLPIGRSKLGGLPDLPLHIITPFDARFSPDGYPDTSLSNEPSIFSSSSSSPSPNSSLSECQFLLQINLRELALNGHTDNPLPRQGMLYVFRLNNRVFPWYYGGKEDRLLRLPAELRRPFLRSLDLAPICQHIRCPPSDSDYSPLPLSHTLPSEPVSAPPSSPVFSSPDASPCSVNSSHQSPSSLLNSLPYGQCHPVDFLDVLTLPRSCWLDAGAGEAAALSAKFRQALRHWLHTKPQQLWAHIESGAEVEASIEILGHVFVTESGCAPVFPSLDKFPLMFADEHVQNVLSWRTRGSKMMSHSESDPPTLQSTCIYALHGALKRVDWFDHLLSCML